MKITVTGSLGNISRGLTAQLTAWGHEVRVISSDAGKAAAIRQLQAVPLTGSVEDGDFVQKAFAGSDAVYLMVPPYFSTPDYGQFIEQVGKNYAAAIQQAGIPYVVNLSSAGSPLAGTPPLTHYRNLEAALDTLPHINVLHLRPGGFYSNFYGSIPLVKHQGIIGNNFPADVPMALSHPADIADVAAEALNTLSFSGRNVQYIVSDWKTGRETAQLLGEAIGQPALQWVHFSDEELLEALLQNGFSASAARHYVVDMGIAIREGLLEEHFRNNRYPVYGKRGFAEFAHSFAAVYRNGMA